MQQPVHQSVGVVHTLLPMMLFAQQPFMCTMSSCPACLPLHSTGPHHPRAAHHLHVLHRVRHLLLPSRVRPIWQHHGSPRRQRARHSTSGRPPSTADRSRPRASARHLQRAPGAQECELQVCQPAGQAGAGGCEHGAEAWEADGAGGAVWQWQEHAHWPVGAAV